MRHLLITLLVLLLHMQIGCGGSDSTTSDTIVNTADTIVNTPDTTTTTDTTQSNQSCTNSPFANSCLVTFMQCWNPSGACTGTAGVKTTLAWANGAKFETTVSTDITNIGGTSLTFTNSGGSACITGVGKLNYQGCFNHVTYTNANKQTAIACIKQDGSVTYTCPDGTTTFAVTAEENACLYSSAGSNAEVCVIQ